MTTFRLGLLAAVTLSIAAGSGGCVASSEDDPENLGQGEDAVTVVPNRSLILTPAQDATALARFSLKRVLQQIITRTPGVAAVTPTQLFQQMFDNLNDAGHAKTTGPHCTGTINGFGSECPRTEGILAADDPFAKGAADTFTPVALVNRFDLAPTSGADCGEYRIIYAKNSTSALDRLFIIFEGRLPNPTPASGLAGCLPVAQLWAGLSTVTDPVVRANRLERFYFTGITSGATTFAPVVDPTHYGMTPTFGPGGGTHGQIRLNMFMIGRQYFTGGKQPPGSEFWQLREMHTAKPCDAKGLNCKLEINEVVTQNNPDASLFASNPPVGSKAESFQTTDFLATVPLLARPTQAGAAAPDAAALVAMSTLGKYDKGESSSDSRQDYRAAATGNTAFRAAITSKLAAIKRTDLTADDILDRATTQSCGGCHQVSNGVGIGDKITWPSSLTFVQVDESGNLSPALQNVFLPHRKAVLEGFLAKPAAAVADALAAGTPAIGGSDVN